MSNSRKQYHSNLFMYFLISCLFFSSELTSFRLLRSIKFTIDFIYLEMNEECDFSTSNQNAM